MFSKSCYEVAGNLDSLARVFLGPSSIANLPSWALDLNTNHKMADAVSNSLFHRAHGANLGILRKRLTFSGDDRLLFYEGVLVDTVASLGAVNICV